MIYLYSLVFINNRKEIYSGKDPESIVNVQSLNLSKFELKKFKHNILRKCGFKP